MKYMSEETAENKFGFILCYRDSQGTKIFRKNCLKLAINRGKKALDILGTA